MHDIQGKTCNREQGTKFNWKVKEEKVNLQLFIIMQELSVSEKRISICIRLIRLELYSSNRLCTRSESILGANGLIILNS